MRGRVRQGDIFPARSGGDILLRSVDEELKMLGSKQIKERFRKYDLRSIQNLRHQEESYEDEGI